MRIEVDNADKTFFPEAGYSKGDLADYYRRIAPTMLPHLEDRPLTLHRFPDGIDGVNFIQKSVADHYPDWIERVTVDKEDGRITHALANDADALVWLVDQAAIAFHVWLSRHDRPHRAKRVRLLHLSPDCRVRHRAWSSSGIAPASRPAHVRARPSPEEGYSWLLPMRMTVQVGW